jgi:hypothetical protein
MLHAHWSLLLEEQLVATLKGKARAGETFTDYDGVHAYVLLMDAACIAYIGVSFGFYQEDTVMNIILVWPQVAGLLLRQTLQHMALSISLTLPQEGNYLASPTEQPGALKWKVSGMKQSFRGFKIWIKSFRGKHYTALFNSALNLLILFPKKGYHFSANFNKGQYAGGKVPTVMADLFGFHDTSQVLLAAVILSGVGFTLHATALLADSYCRERFPSLLDQHFQRTTLIKALMFIMKLELLTAHIYCACEPQNFDQSDATATHYRSFCSLGGSTYDIVWQGILSLQVIITSAVLALLTSVEVRPLLKLENIPGVSRLRVMVWAYTLSSAFLQVITVFL